MYGQAATPMSRQWPVALPGPPQSECSGIDETHRSSCCHELQHDASRGRWGSRHPATRHTWYRMWWSDPLPPAQALDTGGCSQERERRIWWTEDAQYCIQTQHARQDQVTAGAMPAVTGNMGRVNKYRYRRGREDRSDEVKPPGLRDRGGPEKPGPSPGPVLLIAPE